MKLWKVKCNGIGWEKPITYYFRTKTNCQNFADTQQAHDKVQFAGNFKPENALKILKAQEKELLAQRNYPFF